MTKNNNKSLLILFNNDLLLLNNKYTIKHSKKLYLGMNPININISNPASSAAANPLAGNAIPSQANPIVPQAGSLNSQQGSEKKERSIQGRVSPRANENKPNEKPRTINKNPEVKKKLIEIVYNTKTSLSTRILAIQRLQRLDSQEQYDECWIALAKTPNLELKDKNVILQNISEDNQGSVRQLFSDQDQPWIGLLEDSNLSLAKRLHAACKISDVNSVSKDGILLTIALDRNQTYTDRKNAILHMHSPEKRNEAWIGLLEDSNLSIEKRLYAADRSMGGVTHDSTKRRDEALLEISQNGHASFRECIDAIEAIATSEIRDQAWMHRANNVSLNPEKRFHAAVNISDAHTMDRDAALLDLIKTMHTSRERDAAIHALSSQEKRDEVWIARATDLNLGIIDRINAAIHISAADNTILRNTVLIELYNEALNQGQGEARLERIVDAIQDPELQAVAREALEAGGPVRLGSTKSARNIRE